MSKASPSGFNDASMELFLAIKVEFDSGDLLLWNGTREATIAGETYTPAGSLLSVSDVEETSDISARGITITIAGLDAAATSAALQEPYQNRLASVMFGTIDDGVYNGYTVFKGRMDVMSISEGAETSTIEIAVENRLIDLERPRVYRYTSEDQKALYPNDLGLDYVADIQDKNILWGRNA